MPPTNSEGHQVTEASNGTDGLNSFEHQRFDLIITDIVMPEIEGVELLVRAEVKLKRLEIGNGKETDNGEDHVFPNGGAGHGGPFGPVRRGARGPRL